MFLYVTKVLVRSRGGFPEKIIAISRTPAIKMLFSIVPVSMFQADIDRGLKDVKEQRDQLYRKLDLLKAQGIEIMGPNMSVLKTDLVSSSASPQSQVEIR